MEKSQLIKYVITDVREVFHARLEVILCPTGRQIRRALHPSNSLPLATAIQLHGHAGEEAGR